MNSHALPLRPVFRQLTRTGLLTVDFTNMMIIPPYFLQKDGRLLRQDIQDFPIDDILSLSVASQFYEFDSVLIKIEDFYLVSYVDKTIEIQIDFLNPEFLSMDLREKDQLIIHFKEH